MPTQLAIEARLELPQTVAATDVITDAERVGEALGEALGRIARHLAAAGVRPSAPPLAVYHRIDREGWHLTAAFPVDERVPESDGVRMDELAPGKVVVGTHTGDYDDIGATWKAIEQWVLERSLHPSGPPFERYVTSPADSPEPASWRTEICWPVS